MTDYTSKGAVVNVALIVAGVLIAGWSTARDVGWVPGIIAGVVLIVVGFDRHVRRAQIAAERRRRARGGPYL